MFIDYLVHVLSELMTVHEQAKFTNKMTVHELMNFMKVPFVVQYVHFAEHSLTFIVFCSRIFTIISPGLYWVQRRQHGGGGDFKIDATELNTLNFLIYIL